MIWKLSRKARNRLTKLRELLLLDARRKRGIKFDMSTFGIVKDGGAPGMDCGTRACALGLAALSGQFRGLSLSIDCYSIARILWKGSYIGAFHAGELAFDIPDSLAWTLFTSGVMKKSKGAAAERELAGLIKNILAGKDVQ